MQTDDATFFREMIASRREGRRVIIGGGQGYSRRMTIYVLSAGDANGSARRLLDSLFELLPPRVYDELTKLIIERSNDGK